MKIKKILIMGTLALCGVVAIPFILTACNNSSTNQESKPNQPKPPVDNGGSETPKPPVEEGKLTKYNQIEYTNFPILEQQGIFSMWTRDVVERDLIKQMELLKQVYINKFIHGAYKLTFDNIEFITTMITRENGIFYCRVFFRAPKGTIYTKPNKLNESPIELQLYIRILDSLQG